MADTDAPKLQDWLAAKTLMAAAADELLGQQGSSSGGLAYCIALSAAAAGGRDLRQQAHLAQQLEPHLL